MFCFGRELDALVDVADEGCGTLGSSSPFVVVEGGGFGGDDFGEGLSLLLEGGYLVSREDEDVVVFGELGLVADGAVAGDDDGAGADGGEIFSVARIMPLMLPPVE